MLQPNPAIDGWTWRPVWDDLTASQQPGGAPFEVVLTEKEVMPRATWGAMVNGCWKVKE